MIWVTNKESILNHSRFRTFCLDLKLKLFKKCISISNGHYSYDFGLEGLLPTYTAWHILLHLISKNNRARRRGVNNLAVDE
jgi:hypothetical protein